MKPEARLAYVEGFLAGLRWARPPPAQDRRGSGRAGGVEPERRFRSPIAANVYASRVSDFYWWKNHLPLPTWYAFLEVNTTLGRPISTDSLPEAHDCAGVPKLRCGWRSSLL